MNVLIRSVAMFAMWVSLHTIATAQNTQADRWRTEGWKTDFSKSAISFNEIMSGGPSKDGIPPIDNPKFTSVAAAKNISPQDPVIGLTINGDARAYPLSVLMWHEIANDVVGGKPVTVTFCPLCNAAMVFDATVNGKVLSFGTTGKLRNSDLVMYDRKTESWWQQFTGTGIVGEYIDVELKLLPSRLESWKEFSTRNPAGKVLIPNNPSFRNYGRNPYVNYDVSSTPFLYRGEMPKGINPMSRVVLVRRAEKQPLIISMQKIRDAGGLEFAGYQFSWTSGQASALNSSVISNGRDVGTILVRRLSPTGTNALVAYDVTFAFVAHAFHPKASIVK